MDEMKQIQWPRLTEWQALRGIYAMRFTQDRRGEDVVSIAIEAIHLPHTSSETVVGSATSMDEVLDLCLDHQAAGQ